MNIQILDPRTCSSWDELLLRTPGASFFHSSAWARVLSESYGYTPLYFTVIENGNLHALVALMEVNSIVTGKRGVSLPFTDYCEPIIEEDMEFADLFKSIIEFSKKRGWKYVELRGGYKYFRSLDPRSSVLAPGPSSFGVQPSAFSLQPSEAPGPSLEPRTLNLEPVPKVPRSSFLDPEPSRPAPCTLHPIPCFYEAYFGHMLDLRQGEEKIFSSLRDSTRRNIKKAKNQGVEVKISGNSAGVREFYRLNCMTRREHGLPPQPYHFFQEVYDHIISKGFGFITLASRNGEIIAGAVFFHFGDKGIYKYGASEKEFQDLRANNLVMWEGIRWFCNNGYRSLSFGRTEPENKGLQQFKTGWGTDEKTLCYYRFDMKSMEFITNQAKVNSFTNKLFNGMPIPVLKLAGSLLYRHMG